MRDPSRPTVRLPRRRAEFPTSLARRHSRQVSCPVYGLSSTFLHPFAPGPLRPFLAVGSEEARFRAGLRPPPKLHVRFSRMQLSRRHPLRRRELGVRTKWTPFASVRLVGATSILGR